MRVTSCISRPLAKSHSFLLWINATVPSGFCCTSEICWPSCSNTLVHMQHFSGNTGNFVNKSRYLFSFIAMDHNHEQQNEIIKEGGKCGLTEYLAALKCWTISGTEIARVVTEFEGTFLKNTVDVHHHEQTQCSAFLC